MKFFKENNDNGKEVPSINMRDVEVRNTFVLPQYVGICLSPFFPDTPFTVMMEDSVPARRFTTEKMPWREETPPASTLELIKNGIDNLRKIKSGGKSSFCYRKIGHF